MNQYTQLNAGRRSGDESECNEIGGADDGRHSTSADYDVFAVDFSGPCSSVSWGNVRPFVCDDTAVRLMSLNPLQRGMTTRAMTIVLHTWTPWPTQAHATSQPLRQIIQFTVLRRNIHATLDDHGFTEDLVSNMHQ